MAVPLPPDPEPPRFKSIVSNCAACTSPGVRAHCDAVACDWASCNSCHAITGTVQGKPHAMGQPFPA